MATVLQYMEHAMNHAKYEEMADGQWFASIPGLAGCWASGPSVEAARKELIEVLDGWIEVCGKSGEQIPDIDGVSLYGKLKKVAE
jgi:predicted RNase H-like HicB family nuclease